MAVQLDVIGSSPAWPNPGGACSGYLVERRLLLDCGPGVLAKLRERPESNGWPKVEGIAITHLHLDHWGDLVPWVWGALFGPGSAQPKPELRLPPGAIATLRPILAQLGSEDMFERAFEVSEYESGEPFELAGLSVTALPVIHYSIPAFGFRVEGDRTLAYSGDTGPCSELVALGREPTSSSARRRSTTRSRRRPHAATSRQTRRGRRATTQAPNGSSSRTAPTSGRSRRATSWRATVSR